MIDEWSDKVKGGLADKSKPSDFDQTQLKAGIKVEMEHTDDAHLAAEIAMDHLSEDPDYYKKLKKMENEMTTPKMAEVFQTEKKTPKGFQTKLSKKLAGKKGVKDPDALAAWIKRKVQNEEVDEEEEVNVSAKNVHIDLEPHEHEDVYEGDNHGGRIPALTEVYHRVGGRLSEAIPWGQGSMDLKDPQDLYGSKQTGGYGSEKWNQKQAAVAGGKRHAATQKRRMKRAQAKGYKDPQQLILPGMEDVYKQYHSPYSQDKKAQFNKQEDGRQPLENVKGKFMHVDQNSTETLFAIYSGHTYETLPKRMLDRAKIDGNSGSWWGSGAFKVEDDGTFTPASADWDSSG